VCEVIAAAFQQAAPNVVVDQIPLADGGEGTVDAFLAAVGGRRITKQVTGPYGESQFADYALLPDGTAVIEMAAAAGLLLVGEDRRTEDATTYGVGELLCSAAHDGAHRIVVAIGGSATTDGGCGAAAACGVRFRQADGREFVPTGATLPQIASIDTSGLDLQVAAATITVMCDVDNPLTGPSGAAAVFGPQKGAGQELVKALDEGLVHLAAVVCRDLGIDAADEPGAGAAGGLGFGLLAFLGAKLRPGIDVVLDATDFDRRVTGAAAIITGEGSFDAQSARGKVVAGVARRAGRVPVHVIAGRVETGAAETIPGVVSATAITPPGQDEAAALTNAEANLSRAARELAAQVLT
jgi:glycerate kinase